VYSGVYNISDPNESKLYGRRIDGISGQAFWISVHDEEFDRVRWTTIFLNGQYYEKSMDEAFVDVLSRSHPDAIVMDVGGNIGWFTLFARSMGFSVETFEPNERNCVRLCESLRLNRWSNAVENTFDAFSLQQQQRNVNVHYIALGDKDTKQTFYFHPSNPGQGSLHTPANAALNTYEGEMTKTVKVVTLDSFVHGRGWFDASVEIAILKVDIEGYEPNVFDGGKQLLKSKMIKNIMIEMSPKMPRNNEAANIEMIALIINSGYELHLWGLWQGPNKPNPFPDSPPHELPAKLVNMTMKMKAPNQVNLWFRLSQ
jgi:FkbM family methyltransferase